MSGLLRAIASLGAARHEGAENSQAMSSAPPIAIFFPAPCTVNVASIRYVSMPRWDAVRQVNTGRQHTRDDCDNSRASFVYGDGLAGLDASPVRIPESTSRNAWRSQASRHIERDAPEFHVARYINVGPPLRLARPQGQRRLRAVDRAKPTTHSSGRSYQRAALASTRTGFLVAPTSSALLSMLTENVGGK